MILAVKQTMLVQLPIKSAYSNQENVERHTFGTAQRQENSLPSSPLIALSQIYPCLTRMRSLCTQLAKGADKTFPPGEHLRHSSYSLFSNVGARCRQWRGVGHHNSSRVLDVWLSCCHALDEFKGGVGGGGGGVVYK